MAVTVIASAKNNVRANAQTTGVTVTHGFSMQNGDILIAFVGQGDDPGTGWASSSGGTWTQVGDASGSSGNDIALGLLWRLVTDAGSEPSTYTFTRAGNNATDNLAAIVVQVRGGSGLDATTVVGSYGTNDFTPDNADITTATVDALVLAFHLAGGSATQYISGDARTAGAPSGYTIVNSEVYGDGTNTFNLFLAVAKLENSGSPGSKSIGSWTHTADDATSEYITAAMAVRAYLTVSKSESITVTDTPGVVVNEAAPDPDNVSTSDNISVWEGPRYYPDEIIVSDYPTLSIVSFVSASETVTVGESVSLEIQAGAALTINVSDTVTVSEPPFTGWGDLDANAIEAVTVIDTPALAVDTAQINVSDSVGVADSPSVGVVEVGTIAVNVSDAIGVADNPTAAVSASQVSKQEAISVTDIPALAVSASQVNVGDVVSLVDSPTLAVGASQINVSDGITVGENVTVSVLEAWQIYITTSDAVTVTDTSAVAVGASQVNVSEAITVTDTPAATIEALGGLAVSVSDTVSVDESIGGAILVQLNVADNISITDTPVLAMQVVNVSVSETISLVENTAVSESETITDFVTIYAPARDTIFYAPTRDIILYAPTRQFSIDAKERD